MQRDDALMRVPDEYRYRYDGRCWWCGQPADSREHKFKKSDLRRLFGRGPYDGGIVRGSEDKLFDVQGANAQIVKFDRILCQRCNNQRSQTIDCAYDSFAAYVSIHEDEIFSSSLIDWPQVYGPQWRESTLNLARYYVKQIACFLATGGIEVRSDIIDFLNRRAPAIRGLSIELLLRDDLFAMIEHGRLHGEDAGGLWIGPLECEFNTRTGEISPVGSHVIYRAVEMQYRFHDDRVARETYFNAPSVALSHAQVLEPTSFIANCTACRNLGTV